MGCVSTLNKHKVWAETHKTVLSGTIKMSGQEVSVTESGLPAVFASVEMATAAAKQCGTAGLQST